jgi:DHA1 family bicyclomycin/chloramphenicol resistance-like MFS transporter
VAAQALVRDLFPVSQIAQVFSLLILVIAVSPMIAPTVGGYATMAFGWHSIFLILAVITAFMLVGIYFALPDGRQPDASLSLRPQAVLRSFFTVIKQPQFLIYTLVGGVATSAPFAYLAGSSDVFMNIYHASAQEYGWIFALMTIPLVVPTQLNRFFLKRYSSEQIILVTLAYQSVVGLLMVFGSWAGWFGESGLIVMLFLFLAGQGVTGPNASALSLTPFARHAGSAAALMGSFRMGFGALVSATVSILHNNTAIPMVGVMTGCVVGGLAVLVIGQRIVLHRTTHRTSNEPLVEIVL